MGITKTDFMRGMQCKKMLWLDKHKPGLKVIPLEVQERLDAGNDFGDRAMAMFGDYEEMTILRPGTSIPDKKAMIENTREHIERGTRVICEAAFSYYNNYCAADILKKNGDCYDFYEVKNSPEVREQYIKDAGFQYYIMMKSGLKVGRISIVTHGPDESDPFVINDVTEAAKEKAAWVNENIWELNRMQKRPDEIETEPGTQCMEPYPCWYYGYCHGKENVQEEQENGI